MARALDDDGDGRRLWVRGGADVRGCELAVPPAAAGCGDEPSEASTRTVSTSSSRIAMIDPNNATRRRQYTDGGRSPTGRNMSPTP